MPGRSFGEIAGIAIGTTFLNRKELSAARVHPPNQAGISGTKLEGADSIVLSGGYEDDVDKGDVIIYTGAGGRVKGSNKQTFDQELTRANLALAVSEKEKLPVRVTRSHKHKSEFSPKFGYRYDGLYYVARSWSETGKSGYLVWRFKLVLKSIGLEDSIQIEELPSVSGQPADRKETIVKRIVRNPALALKVKQKHGFKCQVCNIALETKAGLYAEAAHIQPLGSPHNGPDVESNLLCLCPNHHVLFDNGGFTVNDDFTLNGIDGKLRVANRHSINIEYLEYHQSVCGKIF